MLTKSELQESFIRECDVCLHLFTKIPKGAFGYRPTPGQRSTTELLRYLAIAAIAPMRCMRADDWKEYEAFVDRTKEMPPEAFPAAMEQQKKEILGFFAETSDEALETQEAPVPGTRRLPLGRGLIEAPLKFMTAYKLQLFLYAKASGAEIGTANAWAGVDPKA